MGLVGINERARRLLLRGLAASPRARIAAVCSRDAAKARQMASELGDGVRAFDRVEAMAGSGEVDVVFVNTPPVDHRRSCRAAIAAGCAVVCEKPLAGTTREAADLARAAAAAGVRTVVNFTYRSVLGYRLTERLLAGPGIGRPLHAEFALLQGHNFLPQFPRASALVDSGVHLFDTMAGLCQSAGMDWPVRVCAAPMAHAGQPDYGWAFSAVTTAGVAVAACFSRSALGWRNGLRWSLYGDDGAITVELDGDRTAAHMARRDDGRPQGVWCAVGVPDDLAADEARFPAYHLDRLVGAARGEESFPGFAAAVDAQRLADALAASAATGRWVEVKNEE